MTSPIPLLRARALAAPAPALREHPPRSFGGPLLVGLAALLLAIVPQTVQLWRDRTALAALSQAQDAPVAEGDRVRQQLESLLGGTTTLAQSGNAPAKATLDALARQGITYTPPPKP